MIFSKKNYKNNNKKEVIECKTKKHPNANLENYSKLFVQLGLVFSLGVVYLLIQSKTYAKDIVAYSDNRVLVDEDPDLVVYSVEIPLPTPPAPKPNLSTIIIAEDNPNLIETDFTPEDIDAPVEAPKFIEVDSEIDDDLIETVPFELIEDVPVYPGCKGTNKERKACFSKKISKFINKKFDSNLANELGLSPGIQRIYTIFKIDKYGNIVDIQAKAPHKRLKDEAVRIIKLLPQMTPGKQRKKAVAVKYAVPITFKIQ